MHSVRVSSQLLVSVLFIAVPTNTKILKFLLHLFIIIIMLKLTEQTVTYIIILVQRSMQHKSTGFESITNTSLK